MLLMTDAKKKIIFDMCLNIIAVSIPVGILQLIVYPITADALGADEYGFMLTIYSIWVMVSNSLGNVLNNVRLLHNKDYMEAGLEGDFLILYRRWNILNAIIIALLIFIYSVEFNFVHIILGCVVACLILSKAYLEVAFRIKLNYKAIVISNMLQSFGFLAGCYITIKTGGIWEFIFILGYGASVVFCILNTELLHEKTIRTPFYSKVQKDSHQLVIATIIGNLMNYADKLVLYPLMGGTAVSIYYTATILGKIIGMLTGPINSVVLSYISRWNDSRKNILNKVLALGIGIIFVGYIVTMSISRPIIGLLFPQWVDEVMVYMPVTTLTVLLLALISIIQPFVLKFCDMKWQIVINSASVAVYFVSALALWNIWGLMGFCVGTVIGAATKIFIMLFIYYKNKDKQAN